MNARILKIVFFIFALIACTPSTTPNKLVDQPKPTDISSSVIPTLIPTADPETTRPPTIKEYCWNTKGQATISPSLPPPQFLYQPFQGALDSWAWTSQVDHKQPNYTQDAELATLGEFLSYDGPDNLAGGTLAYNKSGLGKWFSSETPPADLKKKGYFVFGYQSPTYETYLFYDGHDGHDFAVTGSALATADGTVAFVGNYGDAYGRVVEIYHPQGYLTRYAHLAAFEDGLEVGDEIKAGDPIGTIGGSAVVKQTDAQGQVTKAMKDKHWPTHLHFSVFRWNQERNEWEITDPFGWDPWAGPDIETNLQEQKKDPLVACNGEVSYNIWFNGWPQPYGQVRSNTSVNPIQGRYVGGWIGEEPELVTSTLTPTPPVICETVSEIATPSPSEFPPRDSFNVEVLTQLDLKAHDISIRDQYAYISQENGLCILDLVNPGAPVKVGYYLWADITAPNETAQPLEVRSLIYRLSNTINSTELSSSKAHLEFIEVFGPNQPALLGLYDTEGIVQDLDISGNYAFLVLHSGELEIVDISTPRSLMRVSRYASPYLTAYAQGGFVLDAEGQYVHIINDGAGKIIDVSDPANPKDLGGYEGGGFFHSIAVSGNYTYIGSGRLGILIFDNTNPNQPTLIREYFMPAEGIGYVVEVSDNYVVFDEGRGSSIIDVSSPANPREIGFYNRRPFGVALMDDTIYLPNEAGIVVLRLQQVENGANPTASPPALIRPNGSIITAPYRIEPPTIDGTLNDWSDLPYTADQVTFGTNQWRDINDLSIRYALAWDDEFLYLAAQVTDDTHVQTQHNEIIFKGDSLEMLLDLDLASDFNDPALSDDDFQLGLSPGASNGELPEAWLWLPRSRSGVPNNATVAAKLVDMGYIIEAQIPWATFGFTPTSGQHFGFALSASDNDTPGTAQQQSLVSSLLTRRLTDPTTWGTLELSQ